MTVGFGYYIFVFLSFSTFLMFRLSVFYSGHSGFFHPVYICGSGGEGELSSYGVSVIVNEFVGHI